MLAKNVNGAVSRMMKTRGMATITAVKVSRVRKEEWEEKHSSQGAFFPPPILRDSKHLLTVIGVVGRIHLSTFMVMGCW